MRRIGILIVGSCILALAAPASRATIIVSNASFETPNVASQFDGFEYGPTLAEQGGSGWSFHGGFGIATNGGFAPYLLTSPPIFLPGGLSNAPDGTQGGFIQEVGDIEQSVSGFSAGSYTMSFYAEGRSYMDGSNPLQVSVDGTLLTFGASGNTITPPVGGNFTHYQSDPFAVTAGTHLLEIIGTDAGFAGTSDRSSYLDAVSVNAVPEPASLGLLAIGALAMLHRCRRRR